MVGRDVFSFNSCLSQRCICAGHAADYSGAGIFQGLNPCAPEICPGSGYRYWEKQSLVWPLAIPLFQEAQRNRDLLGTRRENGGAEKLGPGHGRAWDLLRRPCWRSSQDTETGAVTWRMGSRRVSAEFGWRALTERQRQGGEGWRVGRGKKSSWSLGFGGRETDHRNQGRADQVRALVLVSRGGKRACWVTRLGRRGWWH